MACPKCHSKITEKANYCWQCGFNLKFKKSYRSDSGPSDPSMVSNSQMPSKTDSPRSPSGLSRTLSAEMIIKEKNLDALDKLNALFEVKTYPKGDMILQKGEESRDLYFLTEGQVEISSQNKDGNIFLNELPAPNIFGDIGFRFGFPRTASVKAKAPVKVYILKYETLRQEVTEFPEWLSPLLTSFVSGIKALNDEIKRIMRRIET